MIDWLDGSESDWLLRWFGECPASTFGYSFPIVFDWTTECGEGVSTLGGYGDAGVATLVLALENGFTVHHEWGSDVIKARGGTEQRIARNDIDRESYSGAAYLLGDAPRDTRALLARYSAIGSRFLLGLPHEALALRDDASGTTIPVFADALALTDWTRPGQRVVVSRENEDGETVSRGAVIQSATADTIDLDVSPGNAGVYGATIMPAKAIYLEPQQNFDRFESDIERWGIQARGATPLDFAPERARAELTGIFAGLTAYAREFGLVGNTRTLEVATFAGPPVFTELSGFTRYRADDGTSTVGDFIAAMENATYVALVGAPADLNAPITNADEFIVALEGAADAGDVGTGATIEEYEDRPVWDRDLNVNGSIADGVHAMTQILDHGGIPYALGTADQADWFRAVELHDGDQLDWQWFKLFMATVRGRQQKFWLATWREDLVYVEHSGTSLTIDADAGDFTAWWPRQRQHVQVLQADNTVTYAEITAAVKSSGTRVLTLSVALSGAAVTKISWLELCRFEDGDSYDTTHGQRGFEVKLTARVVP